MNYNILDIRADPLEIDGIENIDDKEYCKHYGKEGFKRTVPKEGFKLIVVTLDFKDRKYEREVGGISWANDIEGLRVNDRVVLIPPDPNDGHVVMLHSDIDSIKVVRRSDNEGNNVSNNG